MLNNRDSFSLLKLSLAVFMSLVALLSSIGTVPSYATTGRIMEQQQAVATQTFRDLATGFCLDSNTQGKVYTLGCNGGSFQKWRVIHNKDGTRTLRNLATGFCLDSNTQGKVYTLGCNGGSFQRWF